MTRVRSPSPNAFAKHLHEFFGVVICWIPQQFCARLQEQGFVFLAMRLLSIGDQIEQGTYRLHSRFRRVINFIDNTRMVSVVDEEVGAGPLNAVVSGFAGASAQMGSRLRVAGNTAQIGRQKLRFMEEQRYDSTLVVPECSPDRWRSNLTLLRELITESTAPSSLAFLIDPNRLGGFQTGFEGAFAHQARSAVDEIFTGDLLAGVRSLKGCGMGLTPSGDDFIAGMMIGLNLLQQATKRDFRPTIAAVLDAALGNSIFSNTMLTLASRGLLFARMKDLITVLLQGEADAVRYCTHRLFAVGASSGADLATGFYMTVHDESRAVKRWSYQLNLPELLAAGMGRG